MSAELAALHPRSQTFWSIPRDTSGYAAVAAHPPWIPAQKYKLRDERVHDLMSESLSAPVCTSLDRPRIVRLLALRHAGAGPVPHPRIPGKLAAHRFPAAPHYAKPGL